MAAAAADFVKSSENHLFLEESATIPTDKDETRETNVDKALSKENFNRNLMFLALKIYTSPLSQAR